MHHDAKLLSPLEKPTKGKSPTSGKRLRNSELDHTCTVSDSLEKLTTTAPAYTRGLWDTESYATAKQIEALSVPRITSPEA